MAELVVKEEFLGFKEFLGFQDEDAAVNEEEALRLYAQYKEAYLKHRFTVFFEEQKANAWFKELYDPSEQTRKAGEVAKLVEVEYEKFKAAFERGDFEDCCLEDKRAVAEREAKEEQKEKKSAEIVTLGIAGGIVGCQEAEEVVDNSMESEEPVKESVNAVQSEEPMKDSTIQESENALVSQATDSTAPETLLKSPTAKSFSECNFQSLALEATSLPSLFLQSIPPKISRSDLAEAIKRITEFKALLLSEASLEREFMRDGWILFAEGTDLNQTLDLFPNNKVKVGEQELQVSFSVRSPSSCKVRTCPEVASSEEKLRKDWKLASLICSKFARESQIQPPFQLSLAEAEPEPIEVVKKKLDLAILYLRKVHFFCFYCGIQAELPEELLRRCGSLHIRKTNCVKSQQFSTEWLEKHEGRLLAMLNQNPQISSVQPAQNPSILLDEQVAKLICKLEDAKFRCSICTKLFKGPEFVDKHIRLKHPEKVEEAEAEIQLFFLYSKEQMSFYLAAPQYFAALTAIPTSSSNSNSTEEKEPSSRRYERRSSKDYSSRSNYRQSESSLPPPTDDRRYEGRKIRTYVDLDAPVVGDVDLIY